MKRKLIYSVSICVLAFTLVSAMIADKPMKTQNINVPNLYSTIGQLPGGPYPVNGGPEPIWQVQNNTPCAFEMDIYFGLDIIPQLDPVSTSIVKSPLSGGGISDITFTDLQNQYSYTTLVPPFNITHAGLRIKFPGATSWTMPPTYGSENPKRYISTDPNLEIDCRCVDVTWDYANRKIILQPCD